MPVESTGGSGLLAESAIGRLRRAVRACLSSRPAARACLLAMTLHDHNNSHDNTVDLGTWKPDRVGLCEEPQTKSTHAASKLIASL